MMSEIFLIDSNSLIEPHLKYYPFDFAGRFWAQMENHINKGSIAILDMVENEICKGNDNLTSWMQNVSVHTRIDHREQAIVNYYRAVLQIIQSDPCYKSDALLEWSRNSVAAPWLIATAAAKGYTIITFEKPIANLSPQFPTRRPKIPNIAVRFGVKTNDLFYMMRRLGFNL